MVKSMLTGEFLTSPNELSYLVQIKEQDDSYVIEVPETAPEYHCQNQSYRCSGEHGLREAIEREDTESDSA